MKKLLLLLLLAIPLVGSARMFPTEFPIKAVCWDNIEEAIEYHEDILFNPTKPSWTFLSFHQTGEDSVMVCAITGGSQWDIINPGDEGEKLEL